ncbi:MAG: glycoside hydrolase family 9 protein, partial [Desulfobulbaceae bacterium]|nr:glycoside hydrolase family 9 protein [Desulfobulbaceae bacterium]
NNIYDPVLPRHVLYGALAGGPALDDSYTDDRENYMLSEPACDSNAAFAGVLAALVEAYGPAGNAADPYFPPPAPAVDEFFVNASLSSLAPSSAITRVRLSVVNESAYPPRSSKGLYVRYFVDLSELYEAGYSVDDVVLTVYSNEGSLLKLKRWKKSAYIFYVENSFIGTEITPLGATAKQKSVEFSIGVSSPEIPWNPENDPSFAGLLFDTGVKSVGVALYDVELPEGEELIWGVEPPEGVLVADLPPPEGGGGEEFAVFSAEAVVTNIWPTGYCVNFPMTNISNTPQKPLTLTFVLQADVVISKSWNGVVVRTGNDVEVTLPTWVWTLVPGKSQTAFGYCAQGSILPEQVRVQ